jgi:hypothetical protein
MAIERRIEHDVFGNLEEYDLDTDSNTRVQVDTGHGTDSDREKELAKQKDHAPYEKVMEWFVKLGVD